MNSRLFKVSSSDQRGAVAMLSVTIFAIIITVVATSYIKTVISQQRSALDYDQGTRAYYAAESGVQDGARAIQANPLIRKNGKNTCEPVSSINSSGTFGPSGYGLGYTCQLIDVSPSTIQGSVAPNQRSALIKIEPANTDFATDFSVTFRWSKKDTDSSFTPLTGRSSTDALFPSIGRWDSQGDSAQDHPVHAVLRTNAITHPKANFSSDLIKQRVVFLNPTSVTNGFGSSPTLNSGDSISKQQEQLVYPAVCYSSAESEGQFEGFSCARTVRFSGYNLKNNDFYLNIGSVYKGTDFSIVVKDVATNTELPLVNTQAAIDVTGKSGDTTFRRVKQTLSLGGYTETEGSDAALVVGEGICKHFAVGTTANLYSSECNPLTP